MIEIMNMREIKPSREFDVKVDRTSPLGNPYPMTFKSDSRNNVCNAYNEWFKRMMGPGTGREVIEEMLRLRDLYKKHGRLRLFCWCAPKRCHAETIKEYLESVV